MGTVTAHHREAQSFKDWIASIKTRLGAWLSWVFSSPLIVAVVAAGLTATVVPLLTREWQKNEKQLNLKTTLATDMSRSFTNAIGAGRRIGTGLIYAPVVEQAGKDKAVIRAENKAVTQGEYNRGLGQWQVDRGRLAALLFARYRDDTIIEHGNPIVSEWRSYANAVEDFYRLGADIGRDRPAVIKELQRYFKLLGAKPWTTDLHELVRMQLQKKVVTGLQDLRRRPGMKLTKTQRKKFYEEQTEFRANYRAVAKTLLLVGERFVERLLDLNPRV
jgi:hypothetical protein